VKITAVLDTTILTDVLLKHATRGVAVRESLSRFDHVVVPGYAIKEFVSGPLTYFTWFHNRVVTEKTLSGAIDWLHRLSRTPRRYAASTAVEALREAVARLEKQHAATLIERYGARASVSTVLKDQIRLSVRGTILTAWARLRDYSIVDVPGCYAAAELFRDGELLLIREGKCASGDCGFWPVAGARASLELLRTAMEATSPSRERDRRLAVLTRLGETSNTSVTDKECRSLGDVMIALSVPPEATLVTSNVRDFAPLCEALGKRLLNPY